MRYSNLMAEAATPSGLSSDQPVTSMNDDLLNRGGFAIALANAVSSWRGRESLVLALYAPWGGGKTSVKNFVLECVRKQEKPTSVVEFNPWIWSGQGRLMSAFFDEVGTALGKTGSEELAKRWKKYASRLMLGGKVLGHAKTVASFIPVPGLPLVFEGLGQASEKAGGLLEDAAKALESKEDERSLYELKQELAKLLGELEQPMLIVMDDIDRLTKPEILQLLQLVKVNADFPNLVYLLAFDRAVVEKALDGATGSSGREYLEKIVQAGFDLPKAEQPDLDRVVTEELQQLIVKNSLIRNFDQERWSELFTKGLRPFFANMRDIRRFISTFSFGLGLFLKAGTLEVNAIDLIAIEALRVFEPDVYHALSGSASALCSQDWDFHNAGKANDERKSEIEAIIAHATPLHAQAVKEVLQNLFPEVHQFLRGFRLGGGTEVTWSREQRICHQSFFDRYFVMGVPRGDVPLSTIETILAMAGDRSALAQHLRTAAAGSSTALVFERMRPHVDTLNVSTIVPFVTAVFDVGDDLPDDPLEILSISEAHVVSGMIRDYMMREPSVDARGSALLTALSQTSGVFLPAFFVFHQAERENLDRANEYAILTEADMLKAKARCVEMIASAASHELPPARLSVYLYYWWHLGDPEAAKRYARKMIETPRGALTLLRSYLTTNTYTDRTGTTVRYMVKLGVVENYVEPSALEQVLQPLLANGDVPPDLATEFEQTIMGLKAALKQRKIDASNEP
jgi:predicted KAP-like P-loop ATPase